MPEASPVFLCIHCGKTFCEELPYLTQFEDITNTSYHSQGVEFSTGEEEHMCAYAVLDDLNYRIKHRNKAVQTEERNSTRLNVTFRTEVYDHHLNFYRSSLRESKVIEITNEKWSNIAEMLITKYTQLQAGIELWGVFGQSDDDIKLSPDPVNQCFLREFDKYHVEFNETQIQTNGTCQYVTNEADGIESLDLIADAAKPVYLSAAIHGNGVGLYELRINLVLQFKSLRDKSAEYKYITHIRFQALENGFYNFMIGYKNENISQIDSRILENDKLRIIIGNKTEVETSFQKLSNLTVPQYDIKQRVEQNELSAIIMYKVKEIANMSKAVFEDADIAIRFVYVCRDISKELEIITNLRDCGLSGI